MQFPEIHKEGIIKLVKDLKPGKAPGPDAIRRDDLLIDVNLTSQCLTHIFNKSLQTSKLPIAWKTANITPLHKKGPVDTANNYRPISLTSIPCKILEHIVLRNLNSKINDILHQRQHGFRRGLSCETQLCSTMHDILSAAENSNSIHAVVLDFTKAFDRVPHSLLLQKLAAIETIDSYLINRIHNFLLDRSQQVILDGTSSSSLPVTSGVPQGSVLGPTLFLIYINDLPEAIDCSVSLFADDTLMYQTVNNSLDETRFQNNIDSLHQWALRWGMEFNASKCHIMSFHAQRVLPDYTLGGEVLKHVDQTRYLGVTIQSNFKFNSHIDDKVSKAKQQLGMVKRALHWAPKSAKLLAYKSLCRPHLEYSASVWDPAGKTLIHDIEMVQNTAVRFIDSIKGREGVTRSKEDLGLDTLQTRRKNQRFNLLMRILSEEDSHSALCASYEQLINLPDNFVQTRAQSKGIPASIYTRNSSFYNSFLPRTIRELKGKCEITSNKPDAKNTEASP